MDQCSIEHVLRCSYFLCWTKKMRTDISIKINDFPRKYAWCSVIFRFSYWDNVIQWKNLRWFIKLLEKWTIAYSMTNEFSCDLFIVVVVVVVAWVRKRKKFNKPVLICLSPQGLNGPTQWRQIRKLPSRFYESADK